MCTKQTNATANQTESKTASGRETHNSIGLKTRTDLLLVTAGFMVEGLRDAQPSYDALIESWNNGCFELVSAIVEYAPLANVLSETVAAVLSLEWPGMFDYEVSSIFGKWFADYIMEHGKQPDTQAAHDFLINEIGTFFSQGGTAEEGAAIKAALLEIYSLTQQVEA